MANVPTDQEALAAIREELASIKVPGAESAEAEAWSLRMEGYGTDIINKCSSSSCLKRRTCGKARFGGPSFGGTR